MKANVYAEGRTPAVTQLNELEKPEAKKTKVPARKSSAGWLVPTGLILLVVIPLASGALRLIELASGPTVIVDIRFHILLLGRIQRNKRPFGRPLVYSRQSSANLVSTGLAQLRADRASQGFGGCLAPFGKERVAQEGQSQCHRDGR